jgi:hypothetical protein
MTSNIKVPIRYLPRRLTKSDRTKQSKNLLKSRKLYKKGVYFTRPQVKSFHSKQSSHITDAQRIYGVEKVAPTAELSKATGCSIDSLKKIVSKGEGAYFSSGSRPNQTAQSWGYARLGSTITSGKAAVIDYGILEEGCKPGSKALTLAKRAVKKYGTKSKKSSKTRKTRKAPKVTI